MYWKRSNSNCNGSRRDNVALRAACIINVKFKNIKIRTGCLDIGYVYYSENLNWAAQNLRLGRGLDIAVLGKRTQQIFCLCLESPDCTIFEELKNTYSEKLDELLDGTLSVSDFEASLFYTRSKISLENLNLLSVQQRPVYATSCLWTRVLRRAG